MDWNVFAECTGVVLEQSPSCFLVVPAGWYTCGGMAPFDGEEDRSVVTASKLFSYLSVGVFGTSSEQRARSGVEVVCQRLE